MKTINRHLLVLILFSFSAITWALDEPPQIEFTVERYVVSGDNPLDEQYTQSLLNFYTGKHYGLEGIQAAAEALEAEFRKAGHAFYRVALIPQELKQGIIEFKVTEFKINNINVSGNEFYSDRNILNSAPTLKQGGAPNTHILSRAINMANSQPSKSIKLQFAESEEGGAIDANLIVDDDNPNFFFAGLNNTGNEESGDFRLTGGYQMNNLFDKDHSMSLSYTMSPDEASAVSQFGLTYSIPFYESGSKVYFLLSDSDVDSGIISNNFDVSGKGTVISAHYNKQFLQQGSYKHELDVGLEHKTFENDVTLVGPPAITDIKEVVSRPIVLSYRGSRLSTTNSINFSLSASSNISGGSRNEDIDYALSRSGQTETATADWSLFKYSFGYTGFINQNWLLRFNLLGQESSDLLISGEQFGVGGMNSIRGFTERNVLGDKGYQINLELWLPAFSEYAIRPLIFYDMGHVEYNDPLLGTPAEEDPASFGAGLRWSWKEQLSISLDVGHVTKAAGTTEKGDNRAHLDVFYRFK